MKQLITYLNWEMENEMRASGYFCVMLCCYGIVELVYGHHEMTFVTGVEMFLLCYVIATMQRLVLDEEKDYDKKSYYQRTIGLTMVSSVLTILCCHGFRWFEHRSFYAELFMYLCMICAYITVWILARLAKKYDTKQLNEQLIQYQKKNQ